MAVVKKLVARRASAQVIEALTDTRVVVVNGARQVGKSTLAKAVLQAHPTGSARFLDETATRLAAASDPTSFVRYDGLLLIDEVQRVPDLWLAIKHEADTDPRPGRFLLTGSARLLALRSLPDSLIGRAETIELWPLSQGEIDDTAETVRPDDFRGLRLLRRRLGDRFVRGFVLYCGQTPLSFGGGLWALPISALWNLSATP